MFRRRLGFLLALPFRKIPLRGRQRHEPLRLEHRDRSHPLEDQAEREDSLSPVEFGASVYVGSGDSLFALRAQDGSQKWTYASGGNLDSSPVICDGLLVVGSFDRSVYAFTSVAQ